MKDLTKDSIGSHILTLAIPAIVSMVTQIAYQLIALYFITRLGNEAIAGMNAAGNAMFLVAALAQVLTVGTTPLIAQALGRKDRADADLLFNQSLVLATVLGILAIALLIMLMPAYMHMVAADEATAAAGATFMSWMLPGVFLIFPMAALGSALRGTGVVRPLVTISMLTIIGNTALAPVLIAGWGTGLALGIKGAALATSISTLLGILLYCGYFLRSAQQLTISIRLMRPHFRQWCRFIAVGLPASVEFALVFLSTAIVYYAIRDFGASTQAGFGIGSRVLQMLLLPAMAIALAVSPIAAQNLGARNAERVRETFDKAVLIGTLTMIAIAIVVQSWPAVLLRMFAASAGALDVAAHFLQLMSWIFVAQALVYICSSMFQGLGNTVPSLISSGVRFLVFSLSVVWLSAQSNFVVEHVWYLVIVCTSLQAVVSLWLLCARFKRGVLTATAGQRPDGTTSPQQSTLQIGPLKRHIESTIAGQPAERLAAEVPSTEHQRSA